MKTLAMTPASTKHMTFDSVIRPIAELFSSVMGEPINSRQTRCILHSMLAGFVVIFSLAVPLLFRALVMVWFWLTLQQCKKAGLGD